MGKLSNALPIQWWAIQGKTYNESKPGFVRPDPYIHEWQCDDPIKDQIADEPDLTKDYIFRIKDREGNIIIDLDYVKSFIDGPTIYPALDFLNTTFPAVLAPWLNYSSGPSKVNFSWTSASVITADGTSGSLRDTSILYQSRSDGYTFGWPPGDYQISLNGFNASMGGSPGTMFAATSGSNDGIAWTSLVSSGAIPLGAFSFNLAFTIPDGQYYKYIGYEFRIGAPGNVIIVRLNNVHLNVAPTNEQYAEFDLEFDKTSLFDIEFQNPDLVTSIAPWIQGGAGGQYAWNWLSDNNVAVDGGAFSHINSNSFYAPPPENFAIWPAGDYSIRIRAFNSSTSSSGTRETNINFVTSDDHISANDLMVANAINIAFGAIDITLKFTLAFPVNYLGLRFFNLNANARIQISLNHFDLSFTSPDNQILQFFIRDSNDLYKSDLHLFKTLMPVDAYNGSQLIRYKQSTNYASLDYPNTGNYFALRLSCKFFTEREVETETSIALTSQVIDTSSFIKYQRWLQIPVLPDYMLRKLGMILAHSKKGSLLIDGIEWTKQESVNRSRPGGDIKYPKQMADVWLTEKNTGVRNII